MLLPILVALSFLLYPSPVYATNQTPSILVSIADCESGDGGKPDTAHQFNKNGSVVMSSTHDYGYYQINKIHIKEAKKMGYDIMTEEGNIGFALYLYYTQGTAPWNSSKKCWGNSNSPPSQRVTVNL